jgi:long-chain acyl-CoA synthetase
VVRTTASWFDSFEQVAALTGLTARSGLWLPGPLSATMNLFAAVLARHLGTPLVERPDATHTHLTSMRLRRLLEDGHDLAGLHATVAGDRLTRPLHDRATAAGLSVSHYYGAAELSFVAWGSHEDELSPFPGVEVDVRGGLVWVRSPYLFSRYDGPSGGLLRSADGFVSVGDRGILDRGILTVIGRGDDALVTGGATVLVADVEQVLRPRIGGDAVVLGLPHKALGQVVAAVLTDPADLGAARMAARDGLEAPQRPRSWFHVPHLPLTEAGKLDRRSLRESVQGPDAVRLSERPR